ncbi:MAG: hypothetical protein JWM98_1113 [Thermoleophilia bacterium]|nr:hypothetical protein [Thermoleophilia bacterium]
MPVPPADRTRPSVQRTPTATPPSNADNASVSKPRPSRPKPSADAGVQALGSAAGAAAGAAIASAAKPPVDTKPASAERPEVKELRDLAVAKRGTHDWNVDAPLTDARNAHRTNTPAELKAALTGDFNFFEGDLRLDTDGTPVLSHDEDKTSEGLKLDEWLRVGRDSQRGLKVDVKEPAALPKLLDALDRSGVPEGRLMINVTSEQVTTDQVRGIRARFPDALIALTPTEGHDGHYDAKSLAPTIAQADAAGGRVSFPVRWDIADDATIAALKPHGKVSVWTSKEEGTPDDPEAERQHLIDRGVDGVIDLGEPGAWYQRAYTQLKDVFWDSGASRGARDVLGTGVTVAKAGAGLLVTGGKGALHTAEDVAHDAGSVLSTAGGVLKQGASHIPVVGGLFG